MEKFSAIDLFSGCGGMSLGFQNAGFDILAAYDKWEPAVEVYKKNFQHPIFQEDLADEKVQEQIQAQKPEIIFGGPPCQDFSSAGHRDVTLGRAVLTTTYCDIVTRCMPQYFVMENVPEITKSTILQEIIARFKEAGYGLSADVLDASLCGVPQLRKRYILVGCKGAQDDFLKPYIAANLSEKPMTMYDYFGDNGVYKKRTRRSMMMNYDLLQQSIKDIGNITDNVIFFQKFLNAYELPGASFARAMMKGSINTGISISNKIFLLSSTASTPYSDFNVLKKNGLKGFKERFVLVLAPSFTFKSKNHGDNDDTGSADGRTIRVGGLREPSTPRVKDIIDTDLTDLKASILQDPDVVKSLSGVTSPEVVTKVMIPKIITTRYPDLSADEVEEVREHLVTDLTLRNAKIQEHGDRRFIDMSGKFINLDELNIDLIDAINPFQQAFEVLSKSITPKVLKAIQDCISAFTVSMTDDEAIFLWPKIQEFVIATRRHPSRDALDPNERRLAEALAYIRQVKRGR